MNIDLVHDIQGVYRKVLNAMARPGCIENVKNEEEKVDLNIRSYKNTVLVMLMLLDAEVSFNVVSDNSIDVISTISQITYAKIKPIEEADYVFVLSDSIDKLKEAYEKVKEGTLIDPNLSATIIAEVLKISDEKELELSGPGIKEKNYIKISGNYGWVKARENKNKEYPLGVDSIFLDSDGQVICIPRTTKINILEE
ncbi:MAG: phosphonate C-P lyase system protein PhnH [Clostridiales bacterium]|nr:phosphonate C-P lyase system protein PhnH [Clostridiales bacterium]